MNLEAYKQYIIEYVAKFNKPKAQGKPLSITLRDFDNQELQEFIASTLTNKEQLAVKLRFSESKPTYGIIGKELGVSKIRARELVVKSVAKFLKPENGFRID